MTTTRPGRAAPAALAALLLAGAAPARAQSYELLMRGVLDARTAVVADGAATPLAGPTAFTLEAFFDASGPNLVAPVRVPGFAAYTPTLVRLSVGGRTYDVQPFDGAHPAGVSVAVFDGTTPFGPPGHYAVGLIQDPLADGAGIVPDYVGASPAFSLASGGVVPTTFTGYYGGGVSGGVCLVGTPSNCRQHAATPLPMTWAGQALGLALGDYDDDATPGGPAFTAQLVAVPEPSTQAAIAAGLAGVLGAAARRTRRRA